VTRSQRVAAGAAAVVVAGVAAALLAAFLAGPAAGPARLPPEALALPADASLIAGVEVAELRRAGLLDQLRALLPELPPELSAGRSDPLAMLDRVFYAAPATPASIGVGVALGGFDAGALLARLPQADVHEQDGVLVLENGSRRLGLAARPGGLLFGDPGSLPGLREAIEGGRTRLDLDSLRPALEALPQASAAWGVVGSDALASLRRLAGSSGLPLPPLPPLTGAGFGLAVEAIPTLDIVVLAEDDDGARRFAETAAGALALAQMTARPEWRALLSEVSLGREGTEVRLRLRIPPERLQTLADLVRPSAER